MISFCSKIGFQRTLCTFGLIEPRVSSQLRSYSDGVHLGARVSFLFSFRILRDQVNDLSNENVTQTQTQSHKVICYMHALGLDSS